MGETDNKQIIVIRVKCDPEKSITGHGSMRNILNLTWGLKEAGIFLDPARCHCLHEWAASPKDCKVPEDTTIYIPFIVLNTQFKFEVMELIRFPCA